ncbi:glycyl-tRNA synthetase beta chain [Nitrosomonas cryotolerans]|uniref:Glycine--tRNA ligase beta subunit n=1 Tax=Nitrosomonas cryotolerans ATCC 49181 TaxID=1131553 RepID=A0A1N6H5Y4_9PROT|nr:glycine--tRNA ligase subunit beta [Nitrosomonas cryotolerans]SFP71660.1 glycyl-tRNA synthetase beta chain [Nitrosomonas cryotolerans]SIO15231.1 glycyl-tRNA synthetase beta chain [Nitrosomonas cryotolerans ATCC 49181]
MTMKNLLVELLVEELPPKSLKQLGDSFAELLFASLVTQNLVAKDAPVTAYASPRRLAVHITHVLAQAADESVSRKLMPVAVGLDDDGQATPPLLKKLASLGADMSVVPHLKRVIEGKTEVLFLDSRVTGIVLAEGLQKALDEALNRLPIPRVMTYQLADGWQSVNFVRPAHGLVALHGTEIVSVNALGLTAGRATQGHRFEAKINPVVLKGADNYAQQLETEGAVIANFVARRTEIKRQLAILVAKENLEHVEDEALLDEVTALVERPNVLAGQFDPEFLAVPQECLILTMKANQKYFPMLDAHGRLANKFMIVANIRPADTGLVITGNERVVRSRLADAKFFFDQDRKRSLASRIAGLDKVVYHNKLGMQGERIERVRAIAHAIGLQLGGAALAKQASEAAQLAKADLLTEMVNEFPELQGVMGRYYALQDGLSEEIACAIEDHYKPRFAGDTLPRHQVGICVALADKLETLTGLFGIKQIPTGDKDPFALRRHALGVIRILIEKALPLSLDMLLKQARAAFGDRFTDESCTLTHFIYDRLAGSLREQGYQAQEVEAVLGGLPERLSEIPKRLEAVRAFSELPEAVSLAAANKRVHNILEKGLKKQSVALSEAINVVWLKEPAETALYEMLTSVKSQADAAFEAGHYTRSLQALAVLKEPIDAFFDQVMVFTDDTDLRANRLCLLDLLHKTMNRVADISKLVT